VWDEKGRVKEVIGDPVVRATVLLEGKK